MMCTYIHTSMLYALCSMLYASILYLVSCLSTQSTPTRHRENEKNSFNRSEDDFDGDLRAYNDYLETMEDIIYGLCSGDKKEAEQAQARVREYEDGHRGEITKNAAKK